MKMFVIVYSWAIDEDVIEAVTKSGVKAYTKWTNVLGCGTETNPKMRSRPWFGENDVLTVVINTKEATMVKEAVMNLRKKHPRKGVRCFVVHWRK